MSHKIKLRLDNLEIEVSGDKEFVNDEFKKLEEKYVKKNPGASLKESKKMIAPVVATIPKDQLVEVYPQMQNIIIKQLPKTEFDWVLIYGFYKSDYGKGTFTKKDINDFYGESKRKTKQRIKNIVYNINNLVNKDLIKALNDDDFIINEAGIAKIDEILEISSNDSKKNKKDGNK